MEEPIPELNSKDVLIKVAACGVCGTDVHIYHGDKGSAEVHPPVVLGHELAGKLGKNGISCKLVVALEMALLFALFESFLAGTSNHSFIWVYRWWGVIPVFITTYIPFFLASNYVPDMEPRKRKTFLITEWALVGILLVLLIPLGVI